MKATMSFVFMCFIYVDTVYSVSYIRDAIFTGTFIHCYGVAVGEADSVYVTDASSNKVFRYSSEGEYLTEWGTQHSNDFISPFNVAVDTNGTVYVIGTATPANAPQVYVYEPDGTFVTNWGEYSGGDSLDRPYGIAFSFDGTLNIGDRSHHILHLTPNGNLIERWSYPGLNGPRGIGVDSSGFVYVTDEWNHQMLKFTSNGTFVTNWGSNGSGPGQFDRPSGVGIDNQDRIFVSECGSNDRIQAFNTNGTYITQFNYLDLGYGDAHPDEVSVDSQQRVYIVDVSPKCNGLIYRYRETWEEVHPFIDITNTPTIVPYPQTTAEISGTNLNIAGQLAWINDRHQETTNLFATGFATTVDNLAEGNNLIEVFGTNAYGNTTNDYVNIYRETWEETHPFIDITNENATVTYTVTSYNISGTNNANVVGTVNWTNSLSGSGTIPATSPWEIIDIPLDVGDNLITVSGTNIYGQSTNSVVSVQRKTLIESEPHIATNALIFPSANSELYEGDTTNIIWDVKLINDEMDSTNLIITKISVYDAAMTNEITTVTNDVSNLLGSIPWLVPEYLIAGDTNYLMRFEVVDSTSLTNSRIFFDNEFTIVPEAGIFIMLITLILSISKRRKDV